MTLAAASRDRPSARPPHRLTDNLGGRRRGSERRLGPLASWLLLAPLLLLFLVVFLFPLLDMLERSLFDPDFTTRHYEQMVARDLYLRVIWRTIEVSAIVAMACLILGYPLAYLMARMKGWQAALIGACVLIPLWTSVLVRSYAWTVLLSRYGLVNTWLTDLGLIEEPLRLLYTEGAVILAMVHVMLPFMILPLYAALRAIPNDLPRSAAVLGAGGLATFRHVVLPLSLPGVSAGLVLVFLISLGFFITPALVGGPESLMVATLIAREISIAFNWGFAAALATTLLLAALAIVFAFNRVLRLDPVGEGR